MSEVEGYDLYVFFFSFFSIFMFFFFSTVLSNPSEFVYLSLSFCLFVFSSAFFLSMSLFLSFSLPVYLSVVSVLFPTLANAPSSSPVCPLPALTYTIPGLGAHLLWLSISCQR